MNNEIIYVELATGYNHTGAAWIGRAAYSKSGATVYFNGQAFRSAKGGGLAANYYEIISGDEYWISGIKKNNEDRHWAGGGKILIDEDAVPQYLELCGLLKLPKNLEITALVPSVALPEHHEAENEELKEC